MSSVKISAIKRRCQEGVKGGADKNVKALIVMSMKAENLLLTCNLIPEENPSPSP